jgi:hypothetical protein
MEIDIRIASKGIIETLRDRIAELEELEAIGAATPDTREELVDLHAFLALLCHERIWTAVWRCIV